MSVDNFAVCLDFNNSYFPQGGGGGLGKANLYCDTTPILCPGTYSISGVQMLQSGNRLTLAVAYYDDSGTLHWIYNGNNTPDYWHISEDETYASTAVIQFPDDKICQGIRFIQAGNQLAYQAYLANPDGSDGSWVGPDNHDPYITGSVENIYVDTNPVVLPRGVKPKGFGVWKKVNRMAVGLKVSTANQFVIP